MLKAIWILIGINAAIILIAAASFLVYSHGRQTSYEERGWTTVLCIVAFIFVLLAAVPLYFNQSKGMQWFAVIISLLPWLLGVMIACVK